MSPVKASAATITLPSGGRFLTGQETRDFIGSIDVEYFNGSDYVSTTANYYDTDTFSFTENSDDPVGFVAGSRVWVRYSIYAPTILSPDYITVKVHPHYSIFDTNFLYTAFALTSQNSISQSVYQSPSSKWYIGGSVHTFENNNGNGNNSGYRANLDGGVVAANKMSYIPIIHSQNSRFSAYSIETNFSGNTSTSSYIYYFYVMCPYISDFGSGGSGTFTTGDSVTTSPSGGSDVDLTETNGLLESIRNGISGIGQTILGLFVPDDEFMENWINDMQDLLHDHLGGMYEAVAELEDFWQQFENVQAKSVIHIGECRLPLAGSELVLGNWDVPLKPTGIPQVLYTSLALIIDFLAVMAFLRMCRNKLEIILNPNSEVVKE